MSSSLLSLSLSSSLIVLYLLRKSLFTGHSNKSFKQIFHTGQVTEHPIDATFSFPATQTKQDHTHTTHSSLNEVFSVSSSSMWHDKTSQDIRQNDWLIKEQQQEYLCEWQSKNKTTLFSSKIVFYSTKQHQSAHCPIDVQYVSNITHDQYLIWPIRTYHSLLWPITTHDYHRCLITNNHDLCLLTLSSDHVFWPCLIPYVSDGHTSLTTMTYHYSWLLSHMTYHQ